MKSSLTYKVCLSGIFASFALLSFVLESLFPPIILPGVRLGISNVFILVTAILVGNVYAYAVLVVKVILGSLFAGNISSIIYSLPAGLVSLTIEIILLKCSRYFSVVSISTLGSVINVLTQNVTFCLVTNTAEYLCYSPYLAILGIVSGVLVGFAVFLLVRYFPKKLAKKMLYLSKENL